MYPNPSVTLPSQYPVKPGDQMTALVAANSTGTSFTLSIKDATAGWTFSTTQTGSGFARSSAEVIAEAPSSCSLLFCSEVPLADFGQINYSGSSVINSAGTKGSLATFNANEITMVGQRDDAGHAEQPELRRVVVLGGLEQLVARRLAAPAAAGWSSCACRQRRPLRAALQLERPGVGEALADTLAGPGGELLGLVEHQVGVAGVVP